MKRSTSSFFITLFATVLAFLSVTYISCSKPPLSPTSCNDHACVNGGYCQLGHCVCPTGYEDTLCGTLWNAKFVGNYSVAQQITGSDDTSVIGTQTNYNCSIVAGGTPVSFLINDFNNSSYFLGVVALVDSSVTTHFTIQPYTPSNDGNYHITGGNGTVNVATHEVDAVYYVNFRNGVGQVQLDTMTVTMTHQ